MRALLRERDPDPELLERERNTPTLSEIPVSPAYTRLVTEPIEEAIASIAAREHILRLGKKR